MSESKGLGDSIAKLTKAVGIKPCKSCEKRKNILNKLFPFKSVNVLNSAQMKLLAKLESLSDIEIIQIYNDVFNTNLTIDTFNINIRNAVINDLSSLYANSK
ncbi:hypothetical protein UFOVP516_28 [uncultured Caudovirales phage]|uniref:Uncharacterized protein n=1 Tax=uncultured Caudovirales phage TaxID=2100421 RepID=A0A6J5MKS2_9CAUD|nr:hypothetical protein UFOVP516_28 [uncultured Caudovirales phage]